MFEAEGFKEGAKRNEAKHTRMFCPQGNEFKDNCRMYALVRFILYWLSTTLALWVVDGLFDSLSFDGPEALVLSALVLALVNLTIKPVLLLVTLPLTVVTLGLAIPLINGLVLLLVSEIVPGFTISGFWMGVLCAIAVSFVSFLIGVATRQSAVRGSLHLRGATLEGSRQGSRARSASDPKTIDVEAQEKPSRAEEKP